MRFTSQYVQEFKKKKWFAAVLNSQTGKLPYDIYACNKLLQMHVFIECGGWNMSETQSFLQWHVAVGQRAMVLN